MKIMKRIAGALLTVSIILSGFMADAGTVYAYDHGDSGEYCEEPLLYRLFAISEEVEKIDKMFEDWKEIGVIWEDGSRDESATTKYWVSGAVAQAFWNAEQTYMWNDDNNAKYQTWDNAGYLGDDSQGTSNWSDDGYYLKSIKRSEILQVINAMEAAMRPIKQALNPAGSSKEEKEEDVHVHNYEEVTVKEATPTEDAIVTMQCTVCGQQQVHSTVPGSAVRKFIKDTVNQVEKAPANGNIIVSTEIWTCFNRSVIEALKSRQDVTITVNFVYKHTGYTFTIPAGYGVEALDVLPDENGYCGFMYLLSVFGGGEVSKAA